jgi:hypothetical protein
VEVVASTMSSSPKWTLEIAGLAQRPGISGGGRPVAWKNPQPALTHVSAQFDTSS